MFFNFFFQFYLLTIFLYFLYTCTYTGIKKCHDFSNMIIARAIIQQVSAENLLSLLNVNCLCDAATVLLLQWRHRMTRWRRLCSSSAATPWSSASFLLSQIRLSQQLSRRGTCWLCSSTCPVSHVMVSADVIVEVGHGYGSIHGATMLM